MERGATASVPCDILDPALADSGRRRIDWASLTMPVLRTVRKRFIKEQPFADVRIAACLHVTAETANLMITLRDGGATPVLCSSNALSTQDDVAAALVRDFHIPVYAIRGASSEVQAEHRNQCLQGQPKLLIDSGGDLGAHWISAFAANGAVPAGVVEETASGAGRYNALAKAAGLPFPAVAADDARTRNLFDNRYGTGQSTFDSIIRITGMLVAGTTVVIAGYGACGRGVAARARGLGATVIVTETDPIHALEALMDGCRVMPMTEAAALGDIFVTVTGNRNVVGREIFDRLKDGAYLCNAGHSNVEIDVPTLHRVAQSSREAREFVQEFKMKDGRRICLLAEGRIINLAAAEGHPASVMDIGFATEALSAEYLLRSKDTLAKIVYSVPEDIDRQVAKMKLESMGVSMDKLTIDQEQYLARVEVPQHHANNV